MTLDRYRRVLFNDGEGIFHGDFNDQVNFLYSYLQDGLLQNVTGNSEAGQDPELGSEKGEQALDRWAYCLNAGHAFIQQGGGNNSLNISDGTLFQLVGGPSGTEAHFIPYSFRGGQETWTLTNGDATNPRIDLLQMKLEYISTAATARDFEDATTRIVTSTSPNKQRRVQCTLSVKAGTPAASPTVPTADSGFVAVGFCMVGNGWTTGGNAPIFGVDTAATNNLVVYDVRMPLSVKAYRVDPIMFKKVTAWALSNNDSTVTSSNATNDMYVPYNGPLGRLVGISFQTNQSSSPTQGAAKLGRSAGITSTTFVTRNSASINAAAIANEEVFDSRPVFEAAHLPSAGPTIIPDGTNAIGAPLWTNGRRAIFKNVDDNIKVGDRLVLRIQSGVNAHVIGPVTFYVAEGI